VFGVCERMSVCGLCTFVCFVLHCLFDCLIVRVLPIIAVYHVFSDVHLHYITCRPILLRSGVLIENLEVTWKLRGHGNLCS